MGDEQAVAYVDALFEGFDAIVTHRVPWLAIPASLSVTGFRRRWRQHVIYWRSTGDGDIAIVAILHVRMHQGGRLQDLPIG